MGIGMIAATHPALGSYRLYCDGDVTLLFTDNETNNNRLFPNYQNVSPYVKDGIDNYAVQGQQDAVNPHRHGTKVAAHHRLTIPPRQSATVRLRLSNLPAAGQGTKPEGDCFPFGQAFDCTLAARLREADEFFASVIPSSLDNDAASVMRQSLAGMLWSKQFYYYDVNKWLEQRGSDPFTLTHKTARNDHWHHMYNGDIISMPDKWEYPWYAAWDLAFHVLALALVDVDFAKDQLRLMLGERYLHPNGQIPAYEWSFSDVNHRCMPGPPSSPIVWKK